MQAGHFSYQTSALEGLDPPTPTIQGVSEPTLALHQRAAWVTPCTLQLSPL